MNAPLLGGAIDHFASELSITMLGSPPWSTPMRMRDALHSRGEHQWRGICSQAPCSRLMAPAVDLCHLEGVHVDAIDAADIDGR
jgi:hypothetical protein